MTCLHLCVVGLWHFKVWVKCLCFLGFVLVLFRSGVEGGRDEFIFCETMKNAKEFSDFF